MLKHTINCTWTDGTASIAAQKSASAEAAVVMDVVIPAATSAQLVAFVMDVLQLKSLFLLAVGAPLVLKTNSSGSPANTFTLAADVPFAWSIVNPALHDTASAAVTTDITALYVNNADSVDRTLQIRALYDPTV